MNVRAATFGAQKRIVAPKPGGLEAAAKIVRANAKKRILTYLNLNNHFEGSAPLSLRRFLDVLAGRDLERPPF